MLATEPHEVSGNINATPSQLPTLPRRKRPLLLAPRRAGLMQGSRLRMTTAARNYFPPLDMPSGSETQHQDPDLEKASMSKLSAPLKALINAPAARPGTTPAPRHIKAIFEGVERQARAKNVGPSSWLAMSTAATMTMNSPDSMAALFQVATKSQDTPQAVSTAELMREVGLKCISFNGIPRTINMLGAFRASLPPNIASSLSTTPTRLPTPENLSAMRERGRALWDSIYRPFENKLVGRLDESHPDLPVHILNSHYAALLSDPESRPKDIKVGRILASLVAIACLRAQTGVGPQVLSHVFGLRKALDDGTWADDTAAGPEEGIRWLATDEGSAWILESVDGIVAALGEGKGSSYAPLRESRL